MKMILSLFFVIIAFCANADIVIYRVNVVSAITGGGASTTVPIRGYLVWNPGTNELVWIAAYPKWKKFEVTELDEWLISTTQGAGQRTNTVLSKCYTSWDESANGWVVSSHFFSGHNSRVNVGTLASPDWQFIPKTMKFAGRLLYPAGGGFSQIEVQGGSLAYDAKSTAVSNTAGDDVHKAVERLRALLLKLGFTEYTSKTAAMSPAFGHNRSLN